MFSYRDLRVIWGRVLVFSMKLDIYINHKNEYQSRILSMRIVCGTWQPLQLLYLLRQLFPLLLRYLSVKVYYWRVYFAPLVLLWLLVLQILYHLSGGVSGDGQVYVENEKP